MLMRALDVVLPKETSPWKIDLLSVEPLQLAVVGRERWFDELLSGSATVTPRDRARTAVVRAFAAVVARMSLTSLKLTVGVQAADLSDPARLDAAFSRRVGAVRTLIAREIERGGYQRLLGISASKVA